MCVPVQQAVKVAREAEAKHPHLNLATCGNKRIFQSFKETIGRKLQSPVAKACFALFEELQNLLIAESSRMACEIAHPNPGHMLHVISTIGNVM
jgi:hypothetical protein